MKYKRLTRRNDDGTTWVKCAVCDIQDKCDFTKETCCQELQDRLAELEDKIEQGTLIELPCKVGDTVYVIEYKGRFVGWKVGEDYCNSITFDGDKFWVNREVYDYDGFDGYVFGEYAFLTREEAEKRLKGLQNG